MKIKVYLSYWTPMANGDIYLKGLSHFCTEHNLQLQTGDEINFDSLDGIDQMDITDKKIQKPKTMTVSKRSINIEEEQLTVYLKY